MTQVTYIQEDGQEVTLEGRSGQNLMQLAVSNGVVGIEGACGGSCMCATCHVLVEAISGAEPASPDELEEEILDMEVDDPQPNSRLGCQIKCGDALEAITVRVAPVF